MGMTADDKPTYEELEAQNRALKKHIDALNRYYRAVVEALRQEKDLAQQYLDITPSLILALDVHGTITLLNKSGADILECDQEEAVGCDWFSTFLPERKRDAVRDIFNQLMQGEIEPFEHFENLVLTKKGHEKIVLWHNTLLRESTGKILGILASAEDITERRQVEEQLAEHQRLLQ
ncbi:PAS domain S-box protein, partial [candidate division KSB3 bacterium]|nr:PAS domain S-box protein [candidate division KSB3 bacterium]